MLIGNEPFTCQALISLEATEALSCDAPTVVLVSVDVPSMPFAAFIALCEDHQAQLLAHNPGAALPPRSN